MVFHYWDQHIWSTIKSFILLVDVLCHVFKIVLKRKKSWSKIYLPSNNSSANSIKLFLYTNRTKLSGWIILSFSKHGNISIKNRDKTVQDINRSIQKVQSKAQAIIKSTASSETKSKHSWRQIVQAVIKSKCKAL